MERDPCGLNGRSIRRGAIVTHKCRLIGCNKDGVDKHHLWKGHGNRIPCVFQSSRKSGTPGRITHKPDCTCNEIYLCRRHHTLAHERGDIWLYENTGSEAVRLKNFLTNKE